MKPKTYNTQSTVLSFQVPGSRFQERGITLYLAMLTLSAVLATALFASSAFVREYKITSEAARSLNAVYIADSAMEYTLYLTRPGAAYVEEDTNFGTPSSIVIDTSVTAITNSTITHNETEILGSSGCVSAIGFSSVADAACNAKARIVSGNLTDPAYSDACARVIGTADDCIRIITNGSYRNTNRALEIVYPNL
ncbi:MAG: hypothetical protein AAB581_00860 [Patescibacteria group bacterium]